GLVSTSALAAELKIAVADSQAALMASDVAKKAVEKLQGDMKVQRDRMAQLKTEIEALEAKAQKDGSIMTEKDKQNLQKQAEGKFQEYNNLAQAVQKRTQEIQNELLQRMVPKMEAAIDEIQKASKYDIIIERKNVIFADPGADITKKITEKLNAATAGGK
ncbi:MAG TPA: OmpH family outer membrane protein, partial [Moraxellaceae bacterium]